MDRLPEFEANSALQDALTAGGRAAPLRMTAHIAKSSAGIAGAAGTASAPPSAAGVQQRVQALARLRLRCEPGWPLGLVVGEEMLVQYNSVFVLLLQVRLFCMRLQRGAGLGASVNVYVVWIAYAQHIRRQCLCPTAALAHAEGLPLTWYSLGCLLNSLSLILPISYLPRCAAAVGQAEPAVGALPRLEGGAAGGGRRHGARRPAAPGKLALVVRWHCNGVDGECRGFLGWPDSLDWPSRLGRPAADQAQLIVHPCRWCT